MLPSFVCAAMTSNGSGAEDQNPHERLREQTRELLRTLLEGHFIEDRLCCLKRDRRGEIHPGLAPCIAWIDGQQHRMRQAKHAHQDNSEWLVRLPLQPLREE